jgi:hypothetical protein
MSITDGDGDFHDDVDCIFTPTFAQQPISSASAPTRQQLHQRRTEDEHKNFWHPHLPHQRRAEDELRIGGESTQQSSNVAMMSEFDKIRAEHIEAQNKFDEQLKVQKVATQKLTDDMAGMNKNLNTMFTDLGATMRKSNKNQAALDLNINSMGTNVAKIESMLEALHTMVCEQNKRSAQTEEQPAAKQARTVDGNPAL